MLKGQGKNYIICHMKSKGKYGVAMPKVREKNALFTEFVMQFHIEKLY